MKLATTAVAVALALGLASGARATSDCGAARCTFDQAVAAKCRCDTATNHGQYVSCVAHVVRGLAACGLLPTNCKGKVTRCAARSTCGKDGFVTCTVPLSTCDPTLHTCTDDPAVACTTDIDCGSRCSTKHSADHCPVDGVVGTGSCCPTCGALTCSAAPAAEPGCACNSNADCASGNCCAALGVCG
jgi:hypothetical protein